MEKHRGYLFTAKAQRTQRKLYIMRGKKFKWTLALMGADAINEYRCGKNKINLTSRQPARENIHENL
jgi:hypothetical protein